MLKVGDRVSRQIDIGKSERKYGIVVEVYKTKQGVGFTPYTMYAIKWEDIGNIERGYLEQYLQKEK